MGGVAEVSCVSATRLPPSPLLNQDSLLPRPFARLAKGRDQNESRSLVRQFYFVPPFQQEFGRDCKGSGGGKGGAPGSIGCMTRFVRRDGPEVYGLPLRLEGRLRCRGDFYAPVERA